jgi:hypothetical protein
MLPSNVFFTREAYELATEEAGEYLRLLSVLYRVLGDSMTYFKVLEELIRK